jgi:hypothetical protein
MKRYETTRHITGRKIILDNRIFMDKTNMIQ